MHWDPEQREEGVTARSANGDPGNENEGGHFDPPAGETPATFQAVDQVCELLMVAH